MNKKSLWKLILILAIPCIIGFMPAPAGLSELAWVLFGIYLAAIVGLVIKPFPEPVVLLIAVAASMVVVGNLSGGEFKTPRRIKRLLFRYHLAGVFCVYFKRRVCNHRLR